MLHVPLTGSALAAALALSFAPIGLAQSAWIDFADESAIRLVGDPSVTSDPSEKQLCAVDIDLDGDLDLVVGRKQAFTFTGERSNVLFMNEGGVLVDRTSALVPSFLDVSNTRDIIAFDADGDGWPDLVEANTLYDLPRLWRNLGRDGGGVYLGLVEDLQALACLNHQMVKFCSVSAADVDGDGDLDLYFNDYRNSLEDRLLINDGAGLFADETELRMSAQAAYGHFVIDGEFADMNGDGLPDLVKVEDNEAPLRVVYNQPLGYFSQEQSLPTLRTHQAVPADLDNDGRLDLYVVDSGEDYAFRNLGNGPGGLPAWSLIALGRSPHTADRGGSVIEADMDRDGYVDVLVSDADVFAMGCERRFALLRNTTGEQGVLGLEDPNPAAGLAWNSYGVFDAIAFDLDGDAHPDLVQGTCSGLKVFRQVPFSLPGSSYCASDANSTGAAARIHAHGSPSVAQNDFRLVVEGGVPRQLGIFFYGPSQAQVPFGNGLRCVGGGTFRLLPAQRMGASGGLSARRVDFTQPPAGSGAGRIDPGESWNFQFWYRDPAAGGATFDLSDGLACTFGS